MTAVTTLPTASASGCAPCRSANSRCPVPISYRRAVPHSPLNVQSARPTLDGYQALFAKAAGGIREVGGFSDREQWRFDWEQSYTRDEWLDQLPTSGA